MDSPSMKRARAPNNGAQVPSCLVDGCNSDLSKCREYHRRHKVCELHSKTPRVTVKGQEQRFCQQCSRFHSLEEFDDGKRSCRKRLDGHNRRRRKTQSDPSLISPHSLSSYHVTAGTKFIPFNRPELFQANTLGSCPLARVLKSEDDTMLYSSSSSSSRHQQINFGERTMVFSASSPHGYRSEFQFSFVQDDNKDLKVGSSMCGASIDPNPMSGNNNGCSSQKRLPSCLVAPISSSGRALSLLSSPPPDVAASTQASSHHSGVGHMMPFELLEASHSSMPTFLYDQAGASSSFLAVPGGSLHGMLGGGHDGSSASGFQSHHHTPSFSWE
ncbi:hypothetical protein SAY87_001741 [Trapa incisa]|uniref:SBP-type domain-containing protein n=1 Tax=Trapa incisa TaxID=236973 RepID=A0AAN7JUM9_9MYRT|nr:hypothetical protein SAY87_001741 [Trapa incisa]